MSTGIIISLRFIHNQGGRLQIHRVTCQVPWLLLCSPKGFIPSVLKANLKFLASFANSGNSLLIALHCDPSAGCLNILSTLRSSLCHRNNFAWSLFLNRRFKHGIIGAYHIILAGISLWDVRPRHHQGHLAWSYTAMHDIPGMHLTSHTPCHGRGCSH